MALTRATSESFIHDASSEGFDSSPLRHAAVTLWSCHCTALRLHFIGIVNLVWVVRLNVFCRYFVVGLEWGSSSL